jgi:hypothetical protein
MKEITRAGKNNISRRELIQAVSGAAAIAGLGGLAQAAPMANTRPAASTPVADKKAVYPLFALWLAMTTNPNFLNLDDATIATATGSATSDVGNFRTYVTNTTTPLTKAFYETLRSEFQNVAMNVLAYGGPQCPNNAATLTPVAQCNLPSAPMGH